MKNLRSGALAAAALVLAGCAGGPKGPAALTLLWRAEGLASPESVLRSVDGAELYVSNVNGEGEAKDGNGFLSRLSPSGAIVEARWIEGLDAPKGMGLHAGRLYVSDIDQIVEIDVAAGVVAARHAAPGAVFLNDVAVLEGGLVLASDSGTGRIYALGGEGPAEIWLEGAALRAINGLYVEDDRLVVSTMAGLLLAVDHHTKAITQIADGLGDADGIAPWGESYLVSEWRGRLFQVGADGSSSVILDTRADGVLLNDILLADEATLLIPNWNPSTLSAYRVSAARH